MADQFSRRHIFALGLAALVVPSVQPSISKAADGVAAIKEYYKELIGLMRQARGLSVKERYARLSPIIMNAFDLGAMARSAVGAGWGALGGDQGRVQSAFSRLLIASYAKRIGEFSGEHFDVDEKIETRGNVNIVKTKLSRAGGSPTRIDYVMRGSKVIDLYFNGTVSEVATRRSEFAPILASGGSKALVAALEQRGTSLLGEA